jgi:hypothetical protein
MFYDLPVRETILSAIQSLMYSKSKSIVRLVGQKL